MMAPPVIEQIVSTPVTRIDDLAEGVLAAVEGRASARQTLRSPVIGIPVIGYRFIIDVTLHDGPQRRFDLQRLTDFFIDDGSGQVGVGGTGAQLLLQHEYCLDDLTLGSAAGDLLRLLDEENLPGWRRQSYEALTWHAYFLQPGEIAYACGEVNLLFDTESRPVGYRENALRPTLRPPPGDAKLIVADMSRGKLLAALRALA